MNCLSILEGTFSPPSASLSISRKGDFLLVLKADIDPGGGGLLGLIFAGYVPLASQSPYPIYGLVLKLASYRPHLKHFWANM